LYDEQALLRPGLLDLPVRDAVDEDPRPSNRVIGKVNACSPALGNNASLPAGYYFVSFDYLVLNGDVDLVEGLAGRVDELLDTFSPRSSGSVKGSCNT
jgi:hypothetical protein